MKQTITEFQFIESFRLCGRESQFSVNARRALFEYLESFENDCGFEFELDPIGICCEWTEYETALKAAQVYGFGINSTCESPLEWLQNRTQVIEFDGGIVIQQF
jgi:hypothetical protein